MLRHQMSLPLVSASVILTLHPDQQSCPLCLPTFIFSNISLYSSHILTKLRLVPCHFLLSRPLWSLCPLYWPVFRGVALDPSARGCCPWIPVCVCVCVCTVPAARQPSLPHPMPFYSSAEPAQTALHSGKEGARTDKESEGGREREMDRRRQGWN